MLSETENKKKEFAQKYVKHPQCNLLFKILNIMMRGDYDENELLKDVNYDIQQKIRKNWRLIRQQIIGEERIINLIPPKYHKMYMSLDNFISPTFVVNFSHYSLKISRNISRQQSSLYLLMILKRNKQFFPRRLLQHILKISFYL